MRIPLIHIEPELNLDILGEDASIEVISDEDALEFGEAKYQITEGLIYEYEFSDKNFKFSKGTQTNKIANPSKFRPSRGTLNPNIFVGTHKLEISDATNKKVGEISIEVRSLKSEYRKDYRFMLNSITEKCTELIMQIDSPINQHFETDFESEPRILYQQFSFVKSLINSLEFEEAVHRIIKIPITKWTSEVELSDSRKARKYGRKNIQELIGGKNRIPLPDSHFFNKTYGLSSAPRLTESYKKVESTDTPENRFIKHALSEFLNFTDKCETKFREKSHSKVEAEQLSKKISHLLSDQFFLNIARPDSLKLNSPGLQRKSGYREVLNAWLKFDLAAKLIWKGGDNVYHAGKKDVAALYEYWIFFTLLDIMKEVFSIEPKSIEELIKFSTDNISVNLKQGSSIALKGIYVSNSRRLNIQFSYNRAFGGGKKYPSAGSYTTSLRPDYTLSIWPVEIASQKEAEIKELITHIHFDAKYKVNNFYNLLTISNAEKLTDEENLELIKEEEEENIKGTFKNQDLLKMHAYKDAIRRTGGAYILYPGEGKDEPLRGFHELIPGLGAFVLKPIEDKKDYEHLKAFILKVVEHFNDRASQREFTASKVYDIHKTQKDDTNILNEPLPEFYNSEKLIPDETHVLIGYINDRKKYNWYLDNELYNFRMDDDKGSLKLTPDVSGAKYLLLREKGKDVANKIFKITSDGPKVYSKEKLGKMEYDDPSKPYYLVIEFDRKISSEFDNASWKFKELDGYKRIKDKVKNIYNLPGIPFTATLTELMKTKVRD